MAKKETDGAPFDETFPEAAKPKGKIVSDPELIAMQKINRILGSLDTEKAKCRVIEWLRSKVDFPLVQS